jgi:hypothetical protein
VPTNLPLNLRDLSALERTLVWLDELLTACHESGSLRARYPKLTARLVRQAKSLRASLIVLRTELLSPSKEEADASKQA